MKTLLAIALCLGSFSSFADMHEMEGKTFEEKKAKMTEHLDKKISHLNESKSCVSSATDEAGLKACKKKMWEEKKAMKEKWKEMKKDKKNKK